MISLDFELYWGMRDLESLSNCRVRTANVRSAIQGILNLFREYEAHATWATVGFLFFRNRQELLPMLPLIKPRYLSPALSPYGDFDSIGSTEEDEPSCYAASVIQQIRDAPFQEIGTHTFSHYYCLEDGQTTMDFRSDLQAAVETASQRNIELRSIVFPRNQVNPNYLETCQAQGIICYRGAGSSWMYTTRRRSKETLLRRSCRILNSYVKISGYNSVPMETVARHNPPFDFPGTTHLRPSLISKEPFQSRALHRIYRGLDYAAQHRHMYHLWFHPEDFSTDTNKKLALLSKILEHFSQLRKGNQMQSVSMGELAAQLLLERSNGAHRHCV